jgi:nitroreductase
MDFFELIHARRSIRVYTSQPVEEENITRILEAANHAPSAGNLQAYVILVVRDAATKAALSQAALNQESLTSAPVVLAFFAHQQVSAAKYKHRGTELYSVQDATVACCYAQLAATALGLGSVWVGAFEDASVNRILKAQADWRPVALLPIGYADEAPSATPRRALSATAREAGEIGAG